jgi:hypothetical protein
MKKRERRARLKGLIFTRCIAENVVRGHSIAITTNGPMLRCQHCQAMRRVAETPAPTGK